MFFLFHDAATTEIYTLSLHDALPISRSRGAGRRFEALRRLRSGRVRHLDRAHGRTGRLVHGPRRQHAAAHADRKSTRLNSSHMSISYAVFCLKKKKKKNKKNKTTKTR